VTERRAAAPRFGFSCFFDNDTSSRQRDDRRRSCSTAVLALAHVIKVCATLICADVGCRASRSVEEVALLDGEDCVRVDCSATRAKKNVSSCRENGALDTLLHCSRLRHALRYVISRSRTPVPSPCRFGSRV
jgi:hypothetical protein